MLWLAMAVGRARLAAVAVGSVQYGTVQYHVWELSRSIVDVTACCT